MINIDTILNKLKIHQIIGMIFCVSLILTLMLILMPNSNLEIIGLSILKDKYQIYISLSLVATISYYLLEFIHCLSRFIMKKIHNPKRVAIKYIKNEISEDEMSLIITTFYNKQLNKFVSSGKIDINDGRKAALEYKNILYMASNISYGYTVFAYNLQPYVREFLNKSLRKGKIKIDITDNNLSYSL